MDVARVFRDRNGAVIHPGDILFNPHDAEPYQAVLSDRDGRLFLGDYDSPLERFAPEYWWEIANVG